MAECTAGLNACMLLSHCSHNNNPGTHDDEDPYASAAHDLESRVGFKYNPSVTNLIEVTVG